MCVRFDLICFFSYVWAYVCKLLSFSSPLAHVWLIHLVYFFNYSLLYLILSTAHSICNLQISITVHVWTFAVLAKIFNSKQCEKQKYRLTRNFLRFLFLVLNSPSFFPYYFFFGTLIHTKSKRCLNLKYGISFKKIVY